MEIRRTFLRIFCAGALLGACDLAHGQAPTIDLPAALPGGGAESLLGRSPGAGSQSSGNAPGADDQILGGRPGASTPRVPASISTPNQGMRGQLPGDVPTTRSIVPSNVPILGNLAIPKLVDEGPPDGLSLDVAIDRLVRENLDLRAQFLEIPQAQADILTASLRGNPIFYADSQLIPYGNFSDARPGGQTQYDVNISFPIDVTQKRKARTVVACRAKKVIEAQFQNAVRLQIDNLYTLYVDLLAARGAVRFSEIGVTGLNQMLTATKELMNRGEKTAADVRRVQIQLDNAQIGLFANEEAYRRAKRAVGLLLAMSPQEAESIEPRGTLRDLMPELPPSQALVQAAFNARPDLMAFRLGLPRAEAEVLLARANRMSDVYLLLQPYTFQDNASQGLKSATSYAVGVTVPLPIFNRNQGNIERAKINVTQTQIQLASIERQIINEVKQAEEDFRVNLNSVRQLEEKVNPTAERVLVDSENLYRGGEFTVLDYLNARSQYNDVARQYLDSLVRYRRSMLNLNTAVGQRIVP